MAEDPEKRFQRIMDKLYQFPKPNSHPPSGRGASSSHKWKGVESSSRGSAGSTVMSSKAGIGSKETAPKPCRPWDREDLMRRLATFKAMTWFGKPKVVSPVHCARRGWVNVDMDTIACEACGSRLFFSTSSSWTFQQVEKAAAVFSLKLDNGHKLLCPWIDNVCDESLASFPPTPAPALVEAYKERVREFLQLSALPIISQSTFDYMKCQQLDNLLERSSTITYTLDDCVKLFSNSSDNGDVVPDANISNIYFKAQDIIGLCGWELRLLPYVVDCEKFSIQKGTKGSRQLSGEKNDAIVAYTENSLVEAGGEKECDPFALSDPASAVLDCKLCGACVGLWAFETTPRPLECFTLVDSPRAGAQNESTMDQAIKPAEIPKMDCASTARLQPNRNLVANGGNLNLKLSIAGGVPPTRQDFRPRISLPIISRHLRAQLGLISGAGNMSSDTSLANKASPLNSQNNNLSWEKDEEVERLDLVLSLETTDVFKRKRNEEETCITGGDDCGAPSKLKKVVGLGESFSGNEEISEVPSERRPQDNQETVHACETDRIEKSEISRDTINSDSTASEVLLEAEENGVICSETHVRQSPNRSSDAKTTAGSETCEDDLFSQLLDISGLIDVSTGEGLTLSKHDCMDIASCLEPNTTGSDTVLDPNGLVYQKSFMSAMEQNAHQSEKTLPDNDQLAVQFKKTGSKLIPAEWNTAESFDPIRHHRPFCPWISTEGHGTPGWKLTLFALDQGGSPSSAKEPKAQLSSETDDPILSVRKLFETPPSKRSKHS